MNKYATLLEEYENTILDNFKKLHVSNEGKSRIRSNLSIDTSDILGFCKKQLESPNKILKDRSNYYVECPDCNITISSSSFMILTAHKSKSVNTRKRESKNTTVIMQQRMQIAGIEESEVPLSSLYEEIEIETDEEEDPPKQLEGQLQLPLEIFNEDTEDYYEYGSVINNENTEDDNDYIRKRIVMSLDTNDRGVIFFDKDNDEYLILTRSTNTINRVPSKLFNDIVEEYSKEKQSRVSNKKNEEIFTVEDDSEFLSSSCNEFVMPGSSKDKKRFSLRALFKADTIGD